MHKIGETGSGYPRDFPKGKTWSDAIADAIESITDQRWRAIVTREIIGSAPSERYPKYNIGLYYRSVPLAWRLTQIAVALDRGRGRSGSDWERREAERQAKEQIKKMETLNQKKKSLST